MKPQNKLGLAEIISIAVGTMIGASIFSIFGVGAGIAGKNLPEAFLLSGIFALIVAYSYAKLGSRIVSNSGPIAFILKGIGDNTMTGTLSLLLWLTYVVSIAMFATGFSGYFLPLLHLQTTGFNMALIQILLVMFFTSLNFFGSKAVGKSEFVIVLVKVSILVVFIVAGILMIDPAKIVPAASLPKLKDTLYASVVFFLSYMGFGLIVNASENIKNPVKNIPRAIYLSIAIVMIIYLGVALTSIGNLPVSKIIDAKENALAVAAKPFLGNFGFILLSVGALFSISSALNATIYGGANIAYSLAKNGELPHAFERKLWFKSREGLYITSGLSITFALLFKLGQIAAITSSIFTIIYLFVIYSHLKLHQKVGGSKPLIVFNLIVVAVIFLILMYYQFENKRPAFYGTLAAIAGAYVIEMIFRKIKHRKFKHQNHTYIKQTSNNSTL